MDCTRKCDLCDTPLEFEQDGQRLAFTAHDATFCWGATKDRIRAFERALRQSAECRADGEARLRRLVLRRNIEIELLREALHVTPSAAPCTEDAQWDERIRERMERREAQAAERLVQARAIAAALG